MPGTEAAADHRHPRQQPHGGGVASHWPDPLSFLAFRAISERIRCEALAVVSGGRFQLLSVLLCGAIHAVGSASDRFKLCGRILISGVVSDYIIHHGPVDRRKEPANFCSRIKPLSILAFGAIDQFKLCCIRTCGVVSDYIIGHEAFDRRKESAVDLLADLPEGVLCMILSKLPLNDVVRTSAVSRKWRNLWTVCPKLSFDGNTMCGNNSYTERRHLLMFIRNVNNVLAQCRGKLVEELAVKIDFDWTLVGPLNDWVSFAVSSRTKALVFDLAPEDDNQSTRCYDRYRFPFDLLDKDSIRCLQKIHLSYVNFWPPMQFSGFPNLRELDLKLVKVKGEDIAHMLSYSCNLERLSIVRCHLNGELDVNGPLPHLLYLKIASCEKNTSIAFEAVNLATFEYRGIAVPIDLGKSSELECADICYFEDTLQHASALLATVLTNVQQLILNASCKQPKIPCFMPYECKFSRMTYLQLTLVCVKGFDTLSLVSFLRSAPFLEKLELHFCCTGYVHMVQESEPIGKFQEYLFNNMKSLYITGFKAYDDQVEFLLHMLENTPALEVLSIDHANKYLLEGHEKDGRAVVNLIHTTARWYFERKVSPKCSLLLL